MPTFHTGDYWTAYESADLFLFTSNGCIDSGALIMGAGTAKQVRDRFKGIDRAIATAIINHPDTQGTNPYLYGLLVSDRWPAGKVAAFQTKEHYNEGSCPALIYTTTCQLQEWCAAHPKAIVHMPFPGIGYGGLKKEEIYPIVDVLPDTVNIWEYANP